MLSLHYLFGNKGCFYLIVLLNNLTVQTSFQGVCSDLRREQAVFRRFRSTRWYKNSRCAVTEQVRLHIKAGSPQIVARLHFESIAS